MPRTKKISTTKTSVGGNMPKGFGYSVHWLKDSCRKTFAFICGGGFSGPAFICLRMPSEAMVFIPNCGFLLEVAFALGL